MEKISNAARVEAFIDELSEEEQKKIERWSMVFMVIIGPLLIGTMAWFTIYS
jgi:hypothetical protein